MDKTYEAELAILNCCLNNSNLLAEVGEYLTADHFVNPRTQDYYLFLHDFGGQYDKIMVTDNCNDQRLSFTNTILGSYANASNLKHYIDMLITAEKERRIQTALFTLNNQEMTLEERTQEVEKLLTSVDVQKGKGLQHVAEMLMPMVTRIEQRCAGISDDRIKTGFEHLDQVTGGFGKGNLVIIAGRPSMGKTAFALNIAENMAKAGTQVAFFSLEMSNDELTERLVCSLGSINTNAIRDGSFQESDFKKLTTASTKLKSLPIHMDDSVDWSINKIRSAFRRAKQKGAECIFFDYLQLVSDGSQNRVNFVSELSRNMKLAAKELNLPVVALSQLSRSLEQRQCKKPLMSDLRESGSIEQDADIVLFVYRDEVYNKNSERKGLMELITGKNRGGERKNVFLSSKLWFSRFENYYDKVPKIITGKKFSGGMD
jgi:replicative DNA helicase